MAQDNLFVYVEVHLRFASRMGGRLFLSMRGATSWLTTLATHSYHSTLKCVELSITLNNAHHLSAQHALCGTSQDSAFLYTRFIISEVRYPHNTHKISPSLACMLALSPTVTLIKRSPVCDSRGSPRKTLNFANVRTASLRILNFLKLSLGVLYRVLKDVRQTCHVTTIGGRDRTRALFTPSRSQTTVLR